MTMPKIPSFTYPLIVGFYVTEPALCSQILINEAPQLAVMIAVFASQNIKIVFITGCYNECVITEGNQLFILDESNPTRIIAACNKNTVVRNGYANAAEAGQAVLRALSRVADTERIKKKVAKAALAAQKKEAADLERKIAKEAKEKAAELKREIGRKKREATALRKEKERIEKNRRKLNLSKWHERQARLIPAEDGFFSVVYHVYNPITQLGTEYTLELTGDDARDRTYALHVAKRYPNGYAQFTRYLDQDRTKTRTVRVSIYHDPHVDGDEPSASLHPTRWGTRDQKPTRYDVDEMYIYNHPRKGCLVEEDMASAYSIINERDPAYVRCLYACHWSTPKQE